MTLRGVVFMSLAAMKRLGEQKSYHVGERSRMTTTVVCCGPWVRDKIISDRREKRAWQEMAPRGESPRAVSAFPLLRTVPPPSHRRNSVRGEPVAEKAMEV